MAAGDTNVGFTPWCLYFGPTAALAFFHFKAYRPADKFVQPGAESAR